MKIKLRDMTYEQYKKWHNACTENVGCINCPFAKINCGIDEFDCWANNKELYSDKFLNQEIEIDEPILTDEEREYLKAVIKPFRDNVLSIVKRLYLDSYEIIEIFVRTYDSDEVEEVTLPSFKKGTMYKGMKKWERYTLEELGL